jgi:hypothetical protein
VPGDGPTFWSEEWTPDTWDEGTGTTLEALASVLVVGGVSIASLQVKVKRDDGETLATPLTIAQAEALLVFLQARLPEMRDRVEGTERGF